MRLAESLLPLLFAAATAAPAQQPAPQSAQQPDQQTTQQTTTVEHPFTSPTGHFTLTVPAQWSTETEKGTSEVTFSRGSVSVMVSGDTMPSGSPVETFLEINQLMMQKTCPATFIVSQGAQTVAGLPGRYALLRCPGPPTQPTDIRIAAVYLHGRLYAFTTNIPTKFATEAQPIFDTISASYHILSDEPETPAQKKARYQAAESAFTHDFAEAKKQCENGTFTQAQCVARLSNLQAARGAAEEGSTAQSGQVIHR